VQLTAVQSATFLMVLRASVAETPTTAEAAPPMMAMVRGSRRLFRDLSSTVPL
jgi:hypothetical protein